jgi:hypothetical protein
VAAVTVAPLHGPAEHVWSCDGCGGESAWTDAHSWFWSVRELAGDEKHRVIVTCSDACTARLLAGGYFLELAELIA